MATGQTISDRLLAAKHSLAGSGLAKAVCKATTEELIPPKKKHLDCKLKLRSYKSLSIWRVSTSTSRFQNYLYSFPDLVHCTNEPNVSILQLANLLIERSQNSNWVVVFKTLVTTHHLMCYGNEVRLASCFRIRIKDSLIFYFRIPSFSLTVFFFLVHFHIFRDLRSIWHLVTIHSSFHPSWIKQTHKVNIITKLIPHCFQFTLI